MTFETYAHLPEKDFAGYGRLAWPAELDPHAPKYGIAHEYLICGGHYEQYHIYLLSTAGHPAHIVIKFISPFKKKRYKPLHGIDDEIRCTLDNDAYELHVELR